MIKVKDIAQKTMTEEKRKSAKQNIFAFYIGRPISYLFTIPFLYTKISPNKITILSMFCSILGFIFIAIPLNRWFILIGWFFFFLWNILDGVDGNVARYKGQFSKNGSLFDATAGYLQAYLSMLSYGIAAHFYVGFFTDYVKLPTPLFIVFGSLSSFFVIFPRLIMHKKKSMAVGVTFEEFQKKESYNFAKRLAINILSSSGFIQLFMLIISILALFNIFVFDIFTIAYFIFNLFFMLITVYELLSK